MGYSHFWYLRTPDPGEAPLQFPPETLQAIGREVAGAFDAGLIQYESDNPKPPAVTERLVRFNGVGEDGYETFSLNLALPRLEWMPPGERFDCCKTERKPYDAVVMRVLILAKAGLGEAIRVHSDGYLGHMELIDPEGRYAPYRFGDEWGEVVREMEARYGIRASFVGPLFNDQELQTERVAGEVTAWVR